ncbi:MAG TPA: methyltransferase domain-containing protein [Mycobacteriales bacterium]|nr:methyltransferase domain-containing protein [Mycobacteriales bacterium]
MKAADRALQQWRIRRALAWLPPDPHVLDVGCADGDLFRIAGDRIRSGVGVDLLGSTGWRADDAVRRTGTFPEVLEPGETFDAIVMLAVVEHIDETQLKQWAIASFDHLRPAGRLIITVPSPLVDRILHAGMAVGLLDGMEAHQHHGFVPGRVPEIFTSAGLALMTHRRFQLGLNNLFVFQRPT